MEEDIKAMLTEIEREVGFYGYTVSTFYKSENSDTIQVTLKKEVKE